MKSPRRNALVNKEKSQLKSASQFSSINKFDYPIGSTKNIYTNKSPNKIDKFTYEKRQKQQEQNIRKTNYYNHIRQEQQSERYKAKQLQQKINQQKQNSQKLKILQELQKKKMQLQRLQTQRQQLIKKHGQAQENAKMINATIQVKRLKSQQSKKYQRKKQSKRYNIALERVQSDKQLNSQYFRKRSQSIKRHEVTNLYKSKQRFEAQKYQKTIQEKEEEKRRQKQQEDKSKKMKMLDRFKLGKSMDYDKTCFHSVEKNFIILKEQNSNAKTANTITNQSQAQTQEYEKLCTQRKIQRKIKQQQNRQKSVQRGREALKKLRQAKQFNLYMEQMQQKQLMYNLERIQKGKKNQFIGVKPDTMRTYMKNKQSRAEQEFENMFLTESKKNENNRQLLSNGFENKRMEKTQRNTNYCNQTTKNTVKNFHKQHSQSQDQTPRNIFTIPYNTKIHSIMLQKNKPIYQRQLFQQKQQNRYLMAVNKEQIQQKVKSINDKNNYQGDHFTLDYSMTDVEDAFH